MGTAVKPVAWDEVLDHIRVHSPDLTRDWFSSLEPVELRNGVLRVNAQNRDQVRYLNDRCRRTFAEAVQAAIGRLISVRFETNQPDEAELPLAFEQADDLLELSDEYVFENFVTGPCNRLAHAASVAVAENPGQAYNPLFIHGDVGLGKTHLLQAISHQIRSHRPALKIMYISCRTFTNHFIEAVERGAMNQFRYRYYHVDVLIIDDIQFLSSRDRSQEEFFHTFNTLYQSQRQVVLSADSCPSEMPCLGDRLVSRFNSGLVALVDRPCLETRMAIVRAKAKLRCLDVPEDVVRFVATRVQSNVRELEGALARIHLYSQTTKNKLTIDIAKDALGTVQRQGSVLIPDILDLVSAHFSVRLSDLQGRKRTKSVTFPRQVCMYLARKLTRLSLEEIGGYFGGRDHTTVLHAERVIHEKRQESPQMDRTLEELTRSLRSGMRIPQ